jgi:hypothetical protein
MERISLKLLEIYNLDAELNGFTNPQTGEAVYKGLLKEKLTLVTKYWLNDLAKKVASEKAAVEELKNELIRKFGKADENGGVSIPVFIEQVDEAGNVVMTTQEDGTEVPKKILNPDYQAFDQEFTQLMETEKELEYKPFELSDFAGIETVDNYVTFFKFIKAED